MAEVASRYHFAAHMGQLIAGIEGQGCHNFYPTCPLPRSSVLNMMKKIRLRWITIIMHCVASGMIVKFYNYYQFQVIRGSNNQPSEPQELPDVSVISCEMQSTQKPEGDVQWSVTRTKISIFLEQKKSHSNRIISRFLSISIVNTKTRLFVSFEQ